jgi:2'-5' RNA ligase
MRIFVAIDLPIDFFDSVKEYLIKWEENNNDYRWIYKESIHITLAFLGELNENGVKVLEKAIEKTIENIKKFDFSTGHIIYLPFGNYRKYDHSYRKEKITGFAFTISRGKTKIKKIVEKLEENLIEIGEENNFAFRQKENRAYIPHITIARKGIKPIGYFSDSIDYLPYNVYGIVNNITIFKSDFTNTNDFDFYSKNPKYTKLKTFIIE